MFPADGGDREYTKGDLVDYSVAVAPFMLPHLRGRPLMLERHPDGMNGPQFMQKNVPDHYPDWIKRVEVAKEGGTVTHVVCDDTATLAYLADQGLHHPTPLVVPSRSARPARPLGSRPRSDDRGRLRYRSRGGSSPGRVAVRTAAAFGPDDDRIAGSARRGSPRGAPWLRGARTRLRAE